MTYAALLVAFAWQHHEARNRAMEHASARVLDLARSLSQQFERILGDRQAVIDALARLPEFKSLSPADCRRYVSAFADDAAMANLIVTGERGDVVCSAQEAAALDADDVAVIRRAVEAGHPLVGMSGEGPQGSAPRAYLTLARPLKPRGEGGTGGAILLRIDREWLNNRFASTLPEGVVLRIVDGNGVFVVRQPAPECCVGRSALGLGGIPEALAGGHTRIERSTWLDGVERLQADLPLALPLAGVVSVGMPLALALDGAAYGLGAAYGTLAAICLLLLAGVHRYASTQLIRPIQSLSEGVHRLHQGDLCSRIEDLGGTEFGELAASFNAMAGTLRTNREDLLRNIEKMSADAEDLRLSEARFSSMLETTTDGFWTADMQGRLLDVNPRYCEMSGYAREELLLMAITDLEASESPQETAAHIELLRERGFVRFETRHRHKSGRPVDVEISASYLPLAGGRIVVFVRDMTVRKAADAQLKLAASVFEQANEAIVITDAAANIVAVSRRFTEITGYRAEEVLGCNPRILQSGRQDAGFYRAMWAGLTGSGQWAGEIRNRRRDGSIYPEWLSISAVRDESGRTTNYVAVFSDLTEQKQQEQALRDNQTRLATLIEAIPDAIFFKDGEGRWQVINSAAEALFEIDDLSWHGKTDLELALMHREKGGEFMACHASDEAAWRNGCLTHSTEVIYRAPQGNSILNVSKVPLFDGAGARSGLVVIGRDITEMKRHEQALTDLNADLERRIEERTQALRTANKELESFSYSVSHDLRAPLRAINGFARLVEEEYASMLEDKGRAYLSRIRAASLRMDRLIDDLIELARVSRQALSQATVCLSDMAREIAADLQAGEPERNVDWDIAPGIEAACDAGLMRSVLLNLLGNAWKYSARREGACIEFGMHDAAGRQEFFVRDNGAGFDMAHAQRLFGAFQRLHAPSEFPGSGIGLATVARIVRRHGGNVRAESRPGMGATFFFTLSGGEPDNADGKI